MVWLPPQALPVADVERSGFERSGFERSGFERSGFERSGPSAGEGPPAFARSIPPADSAIRPAGAFAAGPAVAEIRDMLRSYLRAFNRHDATALAAHWSTAGTSIDLDTGHVTSGRDAVRQVFAALFDQDGHAVIDIDVDSIRPIRDDVAVVDGVTQMSFGAGAPAASRFSAVVVREDGVWRMESLREAAHAAAAVESRPLDDLAWLLGTWEDVGEGVTAGTNCFWSAGRGFLVRTHAVVGDDASEHPPMEGDRRIPGLLPPGDPRGRELSEIIGWDPDSRTIRSWLFTSDGRFAEATWSRDGRDWHVHVRGRGRDEGLDCICTLTAVGEDGLSMRCDSDVLAHVLPPACDFLRTARYHAQDR
jgi:uncharacterized protein (TIGR02246 family)